MNDIYKYKGYEGVKIGNLLWMTKNLDIGDGINYPNHPEYGKYYDFNQAQKAAPDGWILPTKNMLYDLIRINTDWVNATPNDMKKQEFNYKDFIGINFSYRGYLRDINLINSRKYIRIPGNKPPIYNTDFSYVNELGKYWTDHGGYSDQAVCYSIDKKYKKFKAEIINKNSGLSVRCVAYWNDVKDTLNKNVDNIELDDLDDLNESMKFFKQSERFL